MFYKSLLLFISLAIPCFASDPDPDEHRFTAHEYRAFNDYGKFLEENTTTEDTIIFVGRSLYFTDQSLKHRNVNRNTFNAAFSGKINTTAHDQPTEEQIKSYKKYLSDIGIEKALENIDNDNHRLVIADHVSKGIGLASFCQLLITIYPFIKDKSVVIAYATNVEKLSSNSQTNTFGQLGIKNVKYLGYKWHIKNGKADPDLTSLSSHLMGWNEFSIPGLCYFPVRFWGKVDPCKADTDNEVIEELAYSKSLWNNKQAQ